ncbi:helix-turn-helix transcriptional regulator [Actinoalloteichus caeruleus]|uniref:helix-turn-helix transcriptional regulator n=1 Tax=Actinoalloteichus cyanogriseus TaxID=2893586 RepID=UPI0004AA7850|nr:helix-turn-helix transcriptional regulator [Actinoalloteichus caeruleus]
MPENVLGAFLRARREATAPTTAGISPGGRRRTPGLRRAELADLAGISVEYLTRLERGRDRHPSVPVLRALAAALRLSPEEHAHLHRLAKSSDMACSRTSSPATPPPPVAPVRPTLLALLDQLEPAPALVLDARTTVLAHTAGFRELVASTGLLDDPRPNLVRYLFTDPRARLTYPDWPVVADARVAALRASADLGDQDTAALVGDLAATVGAEFAERYAASAGLPSATGTERWRIGGHEITMAYERLSLPGTGQSLLVYLPDPAAVEREDHPAA